jgi:hypothetical protein
LVAVVAAETILDKLHQMVGLAVAMEQHQALLQVVRVLQDKEITVVLELVLEHLLQAVVAEQEQ